MWEKERLADYGLTGHDVALNSGGTLVQNVIPRVDFSSLANQEKTYTQTLQRRDYLTVLYYEGHLGL